MKSECICQHQHVWTGAMISTGGMPYFHVMMMILLVQNVPKRVKACHVDVLGDATCSKRVKACQSVSKRVKACQLMCWVVPFVQSVSKRVDAELVRGTGVIYDAGAVCSK